MTQTIALTCAVAASLWAFMRLAERRSAGNYLLFGAIAGLGLISKYNFACFLFILLISALLQPALRARLFDRRIVLSAAACGLVVALVAYWLVANAIISLLSIRVRLRPWPRRAGSRQG